MYKSVFLKVQKRKQRKFYSGLPGLEEIEKPDELKSSGGVWFKTGNIELHLGVEENTVKTKSYRHLRLKMLMK